MVSHLERLIGKIVTDFAIGNSITYGLKGKYGEPPSEITEIEISLFFEDHFLHIYNPISILPSDRELMDLIGLKVISTSEAQFECELIFDNGARLIIDMRDEVYNGPEAMNLVGPNNFLAIWN